MPNASEQKYKRLDLGNEVQKNEFIDDALKVVYNENFKLRGIEFNQNTLSDLAPTHTIGRMKYKLSRVGYDLHIVVSKIT